MPESSHSRKMGVLERHGWEKEVEICGKEEKESRLSESVKIVAKCKNIRPFFLERGGILSNKGKPQKLRWSFPLKRAS